MNFSLYASYKATSDLTDLPDNVIALCTTCASAPSNNTLIELEPTNHPCYNCSDL